jgi:hypothetical protein
MRLCSSNSLLVRKILPPLHEKSRMYWGCFIEYKRLPILLWLNFERRSYVRIIQVYVRIHAGSNSIPPVKKILDNTRMIYVDIKSIFQKNECTSYCPQESVNIACTPKYLSLPLSRHVEWCVLFSSNSIWPRLLICTEMLGLYWTRNLAELEEIVACSARVRDIKEIPPCCVRNGLFAVNYRPTSKKEDKVKWSGLTYIVSDSLPSPRLQQVLFRTEAR